MPYGQSPWQDAAAGTQNMGTSMARIAMAQQIGRMRAQQFAAQMALRQQQEGINQQRVGIDQQRLDAQIPEFQARTYEATSTGDKNYQDIARQDKMDELARAIAVNKFQQMVPGGESAVLSGDITGQPGPTAAGANVLNQADMVRNALQLIAMHNPNELSTMMMGKNIPQGDVNYNPLTEEKVQGLPPRPPSGAPIDPASGMTPYQVQALLLQKSRLADEEKRIDIMFKKAHQWDAFTGDDSTNEQDNASSPNQDSYASEQEARKAGKKSGDKVKIKGVGLVQLN